MAGGKRRRSYNFMSEIPRGANEANRTQETSASHTQSQSNAGQSHPQSQSSASTGQSMSDSTRKKGRGPAIGYQGTEKVKVIFNKYKQPIGDSSVDLVNILGGIARCGVHAPLDAISWHAMPKENLDLMWREVQHKTDATEEYKKACMKKIGELWKKWKHRVKEVHYIPNKDDPEKLMIPPTDSRISSDQWRPLVDYWQSQDVEAEAFRNSSNRKQLEFPHRTGRTSHANIREEMIANNEDTSRANVFIKTRTKKDGTIPDDDTRSLVERMNDKLQEVPEEERTEAYKEQVFVDLFGKDGHGRVRTFGSGPAPRDVFGARSSTTPNSEDIQKLIKSQVDEQVSQFKTEIFKLLESQGIILRLPTEDTNGSNGSGSSVGQARTNSPIDD